MKHHDAAFHFTLFLLLLWSHASAQSTGSTFSSQRQEGGNVVVSFKSSIFIVFGIFSAVFTLTFLILVYVKFCHGTGGHQLDSIFTNNNRFSGLDKSTIDALPFFRFSSLKGTRDGLECAVCLSRFEDSEFLRLLPKCKHAFHSGCIDLWLENHSSCPLCRCKVEIGDLTFFKYSTSSRLLCRDPSVPLTDGTELELLVEREANDVQRDVGPSSRFGIGESFRKVAEWGRRAARPHYHKEESLLAPEDEGKFRLHRIKHRVIVPEVVFKNRWSDLNSSDLTSLNSDMLNAVSSRRFSTLDSHGDRFSSSASYQAAPLGGPEKTIRKIKEEMEKKRSLENKARQLSTEGTSVSVPTATNEDARSSIVCGKRCMSEITNVSRFVDPSGRQQHGGGTKNDTTRMVWLPIARRTIQWFAGREKRPQPPAAFEV